MPHTHHRARPRHTVILLGTAVLLAAVLVQVAVVSARTLRHQAAAPTGAAAQLQLPMAQVLPVGSAQPAAAVDPWARGHDLMRRGAYAQAAAHYANMAASEQDPQVVAQALLLQARAFLAAADYDAATATLEYVRVNLAGTSVLPDALFTLGSVRRAAGDCRGALNAWLEYEAHAGPAALGPYLALQRAACYGRLDESQNEIAAATAALGIEDGGPRLARIEALERIAEGHVRLGQQAEALEVYNQLLALASTRAYRAEMLFTSAVMARALGRTELAAERFRAVVVDYPEQARANGALTALGEMGLAGTVSPYQAGLVAFNGGNYARARALFEQVDPASEQAGDAAFNHAIARIRLGEEDAGVLALRALAEVDPLWAGSALLRAGRVLESNGRYAEADAVYARLLELAPNSERVPEALFRAGLTRLLRDDVAGALAAWDIGLDPARQPTAALQAQLQFWRGKALARLRGAGSAEARDAWTKAAAASPETYYGLRAEDLLEGRTEPMNRPEPRDVASLGRDADEQGALASWLASKQLTPEVLRQELAADPNVARADQLLRLGLRNEATWEIEPVSRRYVDARDLARLGALGDWMLERDLVTEVLPLGRNERTLAGSLAELPAAFQSHAYPAGWGDVAFEEATANRIDPLLLLGLIRQESAFNPRAVSVARAMGLTQVVPATGREIARSLGMADTFTSDDLFRPAVSLQFGAYYMATQLARYNGRVFPALAAYNGGAGNVDGWLRAWGSDADVFVEQIPFSETNGYVKIVYENYRLYERIYGD